MLAAKTTINRKNWNRTSIVLIGLFLTLLAAESASARAELATELDEYLQAAVEVWKFSGTALVAIDGESILSKGYGMANYELNVPNTPETKFLIGSITKQFTATAIMQLVERGLVELDNPISEYITGLPSEIGDSVTVHHLLTHTAGVPSYTNDDELMGRRALELQPKDLLEWLEGKSLDFRPGESFRYSNSGYYLLGLIIENVSGESYDRFLQENIFEPLGMHNTGYGFNRPIIPNRAAGYELDTNGTLINAGYVHMSAPFAAGALYSTTGDMLIWDKALFTDKVLSQESRDKMFTPVMSNYGYGWGIRDVMGRTVISHDGGIDGFSTSFSRWVDDKCCVVVFSNNINAPVSSIAHTLAAIVFDEPYDVPVIKTPIEIDPSLLADYVGVYEIDTNEYRYVTTEDGQLYSQRGTGRRSLILAEADDKFYFESDNTITMTFVRNEQGEVTDHIVHQRGEDGTARKLPEEKAAELLAAQEPVEVDPAIYDAYVGEYEVMPGFLLVVTREDDRLFVQPPGQDKAEMFPRSETEYFLKVVDARITFVRDDSGEVSSLILHQSGEDMPAKRVK